MTYNTISDAVTMQGEAQPTLLVGRYRVVRQLGQGGMGSVWLAEDTQLDNKQFAIKMLPSILVSNKRAYRQLKGEALVAMKLVHPNIVTLRAFEENNGNPFLVMDYIDGETLDDYLAEKGKLSEVETIRLLRPVAAALDYAHSKGVVHRDVKPGNVMVARDGTTYILDFGIAREVQETMTRVTGKLSSGTLLYMSPEQLRGQPPKPAQDVYSFAAMVYECLRGEPPFSRGQIEYQILNEQPEPLPEGIRSSPSIMRGLSKTPDDRPGSCVTVLFAVSLTRKAPFARPKVAVSPRQDAPKTDRAAVRQKRNIAGIVAPLSCLIVVLLVLGGVSWHREAQRREDARKRAIEQQQEEARRKQTEESRPAAEAERKAKDAATEMRIEAKVQHDKAVRISDADGFKTRKDSLEDVFARAEASYDEDAKRWDDAVSLNAGPRRGDEKPAVVGNDANARSENDRVGPDVLNPRSQKVYSINKYSSEDDLAHLNPTDVLFLLIRAASQGDALLTSRLACTESFMLLSEQQIRDAYSPFTKATQDLRWKIAEMLKVADIKHVVLNDNEADVEIIIPYQEHKRLALLFGEKTPGQMQDLRIPYKCRKINGRWRVAMFPD